MAKGAHFKSKIRPNTLCVNSKGQIVYRTRHKEIGEFDALFLADKTLYFVEMTLVKSVTKLKRRLRKKRALLQTLFPNYEVNALIVLNEGVVGSNQFPDFCTVWVTKAFSSDKLLEQLKKGKSVQKKPFQKIKHKKIITTAPLQVEPFRYYNTLGWIFKKSRAHKHHVLDMRFLLSKTVVRYTDLFTKIYIGYMDIEAFKAMTGYEKKTDQTQVIVSLEKEHTGDLTLQYFIHHARKKLDMIHIKEGVIKTTPKDPFGITVTEVVHITKMLEERHKFTPKDIEKIESLLAHSNAKSRNENA